MSTDSSGQWASTQDTLGSTSQSAATTTTPSDNSSAQIDNADTKLTSYLTRNGGQNEEAANSIPILTPPTPSPPLTSTLSRRAPSITDVSTEQIHGTQVRTDKLLEDKAQSTYLPSDGAGGPHLPLLVPVRRPSQSQPKDQVQSAITSPPVSQNAFAQVSHPPVPANSAAPQESDQLPSQRSQESYHVPTAQTPYTYSPKTSGDFLTSSLRTPHQSWHSHHPPPLTSQQCSTQFHQSAPTTPSTYWGTSSHPYRSSQSVVTPQPYFWNSTQPFIPPSSPPQFYNIPNASTPHASQSIYEGTYQPSVPQSAPLQSYGFPGASTPQAQSTYGGVPQQTIPQMSDSLFGPIPSQRPFSTSRKANAFVASDPFRVSHGNDKGDGPSDGLTFDDIPTAGSAPGPDPTTTFVPRPDPSRLYSLPINPTPQVQSIYMGTPQQFTPQSLPPRLYSSPTPQASQSIHAGTPQYSFSQPVPPQFSSIPNTPRPQTQSGTSRPSQMFGSQFGHVPLQNAPYNPPRSSRKRADAFVASDPFQTSHGEDKADAPSTFDDIPTFEFAPGPYGAFPTQPTLGGESFPDPVPARTYGQSHNYSEPAVYGSQSWYPRPQPEAYPNIPATQIPFRQSSWSPTRSPLIPFIPPLPEGGVSEHDRPSFPPEPPIRRPSQFIPSFPASRQDDPDLAQPPSPSTLHTRPKPPTSVSSPQVQPQAPVSPVPSIRHSPNIAPNAEAVIVPAVPVDRPSSPSRPQDMPHTTHEPLRANQRPFGPYVPDLSYRPFPPYPLAPPYLQYPQYKYPNPKKSIFSRLTHFFRGSQRTQSLAFPQPFTAIYPPPFTQPYTVIYPSMVSEIDWHEVAFKFWLVTLPKQMYLIFLLRLPSLYFSRVARIFEEADLSLPEIKKMALETASQGLTHEYDIQSLFESPSVPPAYKRLTSTWEYFIDSVMREWKILNIISVLLLTAIMSILQIESAATDPPTRYTALFSLICTLISLLFGCMYIIRFGTMRRTYKAAEWALEAQKTKALIWWNVWILLAMPAIWLTWSIILYIACIMCFVWRSGVASTTPPGLSDAGLLALRISITVVLGIGVLYGFLIMTTFQRYGAVMDSAWKQRIDKWIEEKATFTQPALVGQPYSPPRDYTGFPTRYRPPTYYGDPGYPPAFGDANDKYPHAPHPYVPTSYASPKDSPRRKSSVEDSLSITKTSTLRDNLSKPQDRDGNTSATPPPLDSKGPNATAEEFPPRLIPKPYRSLPPISESPVIPFADLSVEDNDNALGFSSGLENRDGSGGDALGDRQRVRFRLPSGSSDASKTVS